MLFLACRSLCGVGCLLFGSLCLTCVVCWLVFYCDVCCLIVFFPLCILRVVLLCV